MRQARRNLQGIISRIREDIIFQNGKWDISLYNADSNLSDGNPLYIITSDGVIIERSRPISGLLDLSRYSPLLVFSSPTTIQTVTNETWRILSSPLVSAGQTVGVVLTGIYNPNLKDLEEVDKQLMDANKEILSKIYVKGDLISTNRLETRRLPFNISFQVINRFNKVLIQSSNNNSITRIPTNIDRSYIDNQLRGSKEKIVEDTLTHKKYLIITESLHDEKSLVAGIIVAGITIDNIYKSIISYFLALFVASLLLGIFLLPLVNYYIKRVQKNVQSKKEENLAPKVIKFMKKNCKLVIDDKEIDIPYSSYQYYFCNCLFLKPSKKWETDELLEIFGEDFGAEKWRKVYDTMIALNKKTAGLVDKLFIVKDKRYSINPQLLSVIKASDG